MSRGQGRSQGRSQGQGARDTAAAITASGLVLIMAIAMAVLWITDRPVPPDLYLTMGAGLGFLGLAVAPRLGLRSTGHGTAGAGDAAGEPPARPDPADELPAGPPARPARRSRAGPRAGEGAQ